MNLPGTHDAGTGAELPAGQSEPSGHGLHAAWFTSSWYVPSSHAAHSSCPAPADVPALQFFICAEPIVQKWPSSHAAHASADAAPGSARHEPAAHSVTELAPAPHQPPASHASHAVAFGDDWTSPAAHATHALRPVASATLPGAHGIGAAERARQ